MAYRKRTYRKRTYGSKRRRSFKKGRGKRIGSYRVSRGGIRL